MDGLEIIATRADGLARFMESYARLARLPQPTLAPADLCAIVRRAARWRHAPPSISTTARRSSSRSTPPRSSSSSST